VFVLMINQFSADDEAKHGSGKEDKGPGEEYGFGSAIKQATAQETKNPKECRVDDNPDRRRQAEEGLPDILTFFGLGILVGLLFGFILGVIARHTQKATICNGASLQCRILTGSPARASLSSNGNSKP